MALNRLVGLLTPSGVDALHSLSQSDEWPHVVAVIKRTARKECGTTLDPDDVAQVAAIVAADLISSGYDHSAAAVTATRRAAVAAAQDRDHDPRDTVRLDEKDEDGEPRERLALPTADDPAAAYKTTTAERITRAQAALDHETAITALAAYTAEWKGGKAPAAAIRRALGLPPVTGRAGTAWSAYLRDAVPAAMAALQDEYRACLTEDAQGAEAWQPSRTYGLPRQPRTVDAAAEAAHQAAAPGIVRRYGKAEPAETPGEYHRPKVGAVGTPRPTDDSRRRQDKPHTSGPASPVLHVRRIGPAEYVDAGTGTTLAPQMVRSLTAQHASAPAVRTGTERQERSDFDHEAAAEAARGRRLPGVTVDRTTGTAVAPSGVSGAGSGTGKAAPRPTAPRKASRTGGTGATVPALPSRPGRP